MSFKQPSRDLTWHARQKVLSRSQERRIAQGWLYLGLAAIAFGVGFALAHFAFGVTIYQKGTALPATPLSVGIGCALLICVGMIFAGAGALVLRWLKSHKPD